VISGSRSAPTRPYLLPPTAELIGVRPQFFLLPGKPDLASYARPCHENESEKLLQINETSIFIPGGASRPAGVQGVSPAMRQRDNSSTLERLFPWRDYFASNCSWTDAVIP
jgi:hypothetical protein